MFIVFIDCDIYQQTLACDGSYMGLITLIDRAARTSDNENKKEAKGETHAVKRSKLDANSILARNV